MSCKVVDLGGGSTAIVCSRGRSGPRCQTPECGRRSEYQCDKILSTDPPRTCDRHMCASHRNVMGAGVDYYGPHARAAAKAEPKAEPGTRWR